MDKLVLALGCYSRQVAQISRVRKFVQIHNGNRIPLERLQNEIRPDKACATGDDDRIFHNEWSSSRSPAPSRDVVLPGGRGGTCKQIRTGFPLLICTTL